MTGFVKIDLNCTRTEIQSITEHESLTLALPRNAKHMAKSDFPNNLFQSLLDQ